MQGLNYTCYLHFQRVIDLNLSRINYEFINEVETNTKYMRSLERRYCKGGGGVLYVRFALLILGDSDCLHNDLK